MSVFFGLLKTRVKKNNLGKLYSNVYSVGVSLPILLVMKEEGLYARRRMDYI